MNMSAEDATEMWGAMTMIEAQERLVQMSNSDFPHMKQDARKKEHRRVYKNAFPDVFETADSNVISSRESHILMTEMLNGRR